MQKICAIILLSGLASNFEALPQTKWSRQIRNPQGQLIRERRQFPFGEWIPLSQPCPTCRPFADPLDAGSRGENIGLTPPRPPTVTRQIHGEGNFFPQDESSILSVPPPPPSAIPRHPIPNNNGNFQFSSFGQQFNTPLAVPTLKSFPQTQQIQFLSQTSFLGNQPLIVNGNQQVLPGLNGQNNLFGREQSQQQVNNGKVTTFNSEFKTQKVPENVVLEQNKRPIAQKQPFGNKPQPFTSSNHNQQQSFVQQQSFGGQQQHSGNFGNSILTPPPAPNNGSRDIVIPGLDKEEIQLLYVPVETLRQRGTPQEQLLTQQPQNIQFFNRPSGLQQSVNTVRPTGQSLANQPKGHFVTQNGNQKQTDSSLKVTSTQPFPTSVTPSTALFQHLPFKQTPQPFVSATPATPTIQSFVTPASVFQKFSPFTPETTLSHLSTVPNTVQFSQSDIEFGTTPKAIASQGVFGEEIVNGKTQFSGFKSAGFNQEQERPLQQPLQQSFVGQQQTVTQQPQLNTVFTQEAQKEILTQSQFPHKIDQQQIALQKQQEHQKLLQEQRLKELEEQRFLEQQRKQKEAEEQQLLQQRQKELEQQRYLQKQKELEEQRLLQLQRQKELEQQRNLQKQKELEEQRLLQQQRQKELEQQRYLQKQKELEEQKFLQKQKELEEQRLLQQQRQRELDKQKFLQEQLQRELENQRRAQLQKQKELEEKRRLQLKQKEEEQRLLRFQQQQKELEQQRLLQQQQEEQERLIQQQNLQKQKQENLKKQQQFQLFQQQQKQQQQNLQQQNFPQQVLQQVNRHVLPPDNSNFIPQPEKEAEPEDQELVPHQPPLSVFFKSYNGAEARISDVLRELRSSGTITVLDQYFEKMPKVFVGPAGLIPPPGYGKFELPYLSNLESNKIEKRIDKLPFFVAPLNFIPPPGYAKIPFPAPHVGSVVVSSESNPAMSLSSLEKGSAEQEGSFPVVGPELPGLINNLNTVTTTPKPTTYVSTPSLPQTTAQLRNRRPNSSLYKPQNRKPITRTRPTTTSKPEEEVTQPIPKVELTKDSEGGIRKPFNRFLNRRRQQAKSTTESPLRSQQDGKSLENRHYSVEVYHQEKNQVPRTQQKSDVIQENQEGVQNIRQFESSIDRITPSGHGVFEVRPTSDYSKSSEITESEERRPEISDYSDVNLQTFEDGPLPTGSAKTITQELYRPNAIKQAEGNVNFKEWSKSESTPTPVNYQPSAYEGASTLKYSEIPDVSPTVESGTFKDSVSEEQVSVQPTSIVGFEKQDGSFESHSTTEAPQTKVSFTPGPLTASGEEHAKGFLGSNEQFTSAFAEISKPHHIPGFTDSSKRQQSQHSNTYPTPEISVDLQAPYSDSQQSQEFDVSSEVKSAQNSGEFSNNKFAPTGSSNEQYLTGFDKGTSNQQSLAISAGQVSPTAPGATEEQHTLGSFANSHTPNSAEVQRHQEEQRIGSFISLHDSQPPTNSPVNPQQYFPSSTGFPSQPTSVEGERNYEYPIAVDQSRPQVSSTPETIAEVTVNPSVQTYTSGSITEGSVNFNEQTQTTEGPGHDVADDLPDHRVKFPNPSIVRVRTRVRNKPRGQVNFAASQSTTPAPITRTRVDSRYNENIDQEYTTKANSYREYNPVKISKFSPLRGIKKPVRTTTEATTENEHKANVYTIRPPRRPLNPSTVSTKRIRRPTTPLPSAESATEAFGFSTVGPYSQPEHADISPSGVSNDVYYEQSSLSPVKHKFRKHFGTAEQKNDFVPAFVSTPYPTAAPTYSTFAQDSYSEESYFGRNVAQTEASLSDNSERYPEWNPSESGFDVSRIVLTTIRPSGQEDQTDLEEPKKSLDNKKAFDPDLEKKTGRRRVRVRVHKRPHENFETAESQNLRTVANVLVPPTTTYKPSDEANIHQLAKNADFSFGGQKLFGIRSREYFKKRLNLTQSEETAQNNEEQLEGGNARGGVTNSTEKTKVLAFVRKTEKVPKNDSDSVSVQANEGSEGKIVRPKFRGFVRKIVKHGGANKEAESESNQVTENEENEGKHTSAEFHPRHPLRVNQSGFNHTGRVNGTRHKTFIRYVKKNKVRPHETEIHQESNQQELQKEGQVLHQTTETHTSTPAPQVITSTETRIIDIQDVNEEKKTETHVSVQSSEQKENRDSQQTISTEQQTEGVLIKTAQASEHGEVQESSSQVYQESTSSSAQPTTSLTQLTGLYITQRPKFYQTLRPVFQRTSQAGFQRTREPESHTSSTEQTAQEPQEKRNGFGRFKYGKNTGYSTTSSEKLEETTKANDQQAKNKNLHTLEVRKYLRTKSREGAFSQFSKNKYFTSEKTETVDTSKDEEITEKESEEITTEKSGKISVSEPETTQPIVARTDSLEIEGKTTKNEEESETEVTTTDAISSSEEESSEEEEEEEDEDEDATTSANFETTTESEIQTTIFQASETPEKVLEPKLSTSTTESVEAQRTEYQPDIYRFSKNSFSFDEAEKFTGTKNRAHVRNITTDIIENTASFSAPGVDKLPEIRVVTHRADEEFPAATESHSEFVQKEKTEGATTESNSLETTSEYPELDTTASSEAATKAKVAKILKTSTTTKVSHETEICYRGKCIRTKSENPDEDLKLLVDSASTMKIEKRKT